MRELAYLTAAIALSAAFVGALIWLERGLAERNSEHALTCRVVHRELSATPTVPTREVWMCADGWVFVR